MTEKQGSPLLYAAVSVALIAFVLIVAKNGPAVMGSPLMYVAAMLAIAGLISLYRPGWQLLMSGVAAHGAAFMLIRALADIGGEVRLGYWCLVISAWLMAWVFVQSLAALKTRGRRHRRAVNGSFRSLGLWILLLWEIVVRWLRNSRRFSSPPQPDLGANRFRTPTLAVDLSPDLQGGAVRLPGRCLFRSWSPSLPIAVVSLRAAGSCQSAT